MPSKLYGKQNIQQYTDESLCYSYQVQPNWEHWIKMTKLNKMIENQSILHQVQKELQYSEDRTSPLPIQIHIAIITAIFTVFRAVTTQTRQFLPSVETVLKLHTSANQGKQPFLAIFITNFLPPPAIAVTTYPSSCGQDTPVLSSFSLLSQSDCRTGFFPIFKPILLSSDHLPIHDNFCTPELVSLLLRPISSK